MNAKLVFHDHHSTLRKGRNLVSPSLEEVVEINELETRLKYFDIRKSPIGTIFINPISRFLIQSLFSSKLEVNVSVDSISWGREIQEQEQLEVSDTVLAIIAGASAAFLVGIVICIYLCHKCSKKRSTSTPTGNSGREKHTNVIIVQDPYPPKSKNQVVVGTKRSRPPFSVVNVNECENRSVDDTTLGELSAGRKPKLPTKKITLSNQTVVSGLDMTGAASVLEKKSTPRPPLEKIALSTQTLVSGLETIDGGLPEAARMIRQLPRTSPPNIPTNEFQFLHDDLKKYSMSSFRNGPAIATSSRISNALRPNNAKIPNEKNSYEMKFPISKELTLDATTTEESSNNHKITHNKEDNTNVPHRIEETHQSRDIPHYQSSRDDVESSSECESCSNDLSPNSSMNLSHISQRRINLTAPPGKVGVILANRSDRKGTIVSEVRGSSPLCGKIFEGDKIVEIDGVDVSRKSVSEVSDVMASKTNVSRTLGVVTSRNKDDQ